MLVVKSMDVRDNFKHFCDRVFQGETLIISRPKNENVVMLSESEYNEMMKAIQNAEYYDKLAQSFEQLTISWINTKTGKAKRYKASFV